MDLPYQPSLRVNLKGSDRSGIADRRKIQDKDNSKKSCYGKYNLQGP